MNKSFSIKPNLNDHTLIKKVKGKDHLGNDYSQNVVVERPLTIFLNSSSLILLYFLVIGNLKLDEYYYCY